MRTDAKDPMALTWSPYIEFIIKEFENLQSLQAASSQRDGSAVSVDLCHGCCDNLQNRAEIDFVLLQPGTLHLLKEALCRPLLR